MTNLRQLPVASTAAMARVPTVFLSCPNCNQPVLSANLPTHEAHCSRHFTRCPHCDELTHTAHLPAHIERAVGDMRTLCDALERGDLSRISSALAHGGSTITEWRDSHGNSLLHLIAQRGAEQSAVGQSSAISRCLRELLRHNTDVNCSNEHGLTPLHAAAKAGSLQVLTVLLEAGCDPSATSKLGSTPLSMASSDEVRLLLMKAGAVLRRPCAQATELVRHSVPLSPPRFEKKNDRIEWSKKNLTSTTTLEASSIKTGDKGGDLRAQYMLPKGLPTQQLGVGSAEDGNPDVDARFMQQRNPRDVALLKPALIPPSSSRHAQRLRDVVKAVQDSSVIQEMI